MKSIELLNMLTDYAKHYRVDALASVLRNRHMNEVNKFDLIDQTHVDAILNDFINFIGYKNCVDYGLYTKDLIIKPPRQE